MESLQKMQAEDVAEVVKVIASHDEDDAAEAERMYQESEGLVDQFVVKENDKIIAVTGFAAPYSCVNTYYLSWTYVDDEATGQGVGTKMLTELLNYLSEINARKIFVKVSNYIDEDDYDVYAAARHVYEKLGFELELTQSDYFDDSEDQLVYSLRMNEKTSEEEQIVFALESKNIKFTGIYELAETEKSYTFAWDESGDEIFTEADVQVGLAEAQKQKARLVFLGFPSIYQGVEEPLLKAGFIKIGSLLDYYEEGIDEDHYIYQF